MPQRNTSAGTVGRREASSPEAMEACPMVVDMKAGVARRCTAWQEYRLGWNLDYRTLRRGRPLSVSMSAVYDMRHKIDATSEVAVMR